ncbi:MAG: aminotransferase class V-fold PLP-dependent enzyme [Woeseia sp.]
MNPSDRSLFDMPADDPADAPRQTVYLNTAYVGPRLKAVSDAGRKAVDLYATPWLLSGDHWFGAPERLRETVARLLTVHPDSIALVPSASYAIAIAAKNLPVAAGEGIVIVEEQYPSNVYAWRRRAEESGAVLRVAGRSAARPLTESVLELVDSNTAVVAIPNCHWTDGELIDVVAIARAARAAGAALVIDASQSLGALPIDIAAVKPDFLVSVGYKWLLGPYGLGYLYVDEAWQTRGIPLEETWVARRGSEDFSKLVEYVDEYRAGARRFDYGEFSRFIAVAMATAAISQLNRWGASYIAAELNERAERVRTMCARTGLATLAAERSAPHIVGIRIPEELEPAKFGEALACAGIHVSVRGRTIRVAPHLHTDEPDLERFGSVLGKLL